MAEISGQKYNTPCPPFRAKRANFIFLPTFFCHCLPFENVCIRPCSPEVIFARSLNEIKRTVAVVRRETNSWKWPIFQWVYMGVLAWVLAFATWQGGHLLGFK
jgi:hypothetical protein